MTTFEKLKSIANKLNVDVKETIFVKSCFDYGYNIIFINCKQGCPFEILAHELGHVTGLFLKRSFKNLHWFDDNYNNEELIADLIAIELSKIFNFKITQCAQRAAQYQHYIGTDIAKKVNDSVDFLITTYQNK